MQLDQMGQMGQMGRSGYSRPIDSCMFASGGIAPICAATVGASLRFTGAIRGRI